MEAIDRENISLCGQISALKHPRNTLVPISKLPNELLSRLFFDYARESGSLFDLQWTKLLLVCRRWNSVARQDQPLWSFIKVHGYNDEDKVLTGVDSTSSFWRCSLDSQVHAGRSLLSPAALGSH